MLNRDNTIKIGAMAMSIIIVLIIAVLLNQNSIPEQSQTQTFPVSDAPAVETSPEPAPQQEPVVTPEPTPAEISENSDDSSSGSSHNLPILPTPKIETPSFTVLDFNDCPDTGGNWTINSSYQLNTSISCDNINITGGSTLEIYNESVHIQSNYIYIENASTLTHRANTVSHLYDLDISVINLTIESGGSIDVDEKGFYNSGADTGFGPGGGTDGETSSGGGYGGKGGRGGGDGGVDGGDSYGSLYEPTDLGSAGGDCKGSDGGGAIFLNVSDTLTNNGIISSDSARPPNQGCDSWSRSGSSGGSGGSVYIITNSIYGAGTITANGGDGSDSAYDQGPGAGGGGGRIAIYYTDDYSNMTITAQGGARLNSKTRDGGAGTIYLQGPGFSELIVDNLGRATSETTLKENLNVDNLTIKNGAIFKINYSYTVNVSNLIADSGRINNYGYFNADNLVNSTILGLTINNYCGNLSFLESSDVLTIGSGSTLTLSGCEMDSINPDLELTVANDGVLGHLPNYGDYEYFLYHLGYTTILNYSLNLTLPKISVESGGLITANGVGYSGGQNAFYGDGTPNGPGAGNDPYGNSNGGSGGAYGGDGGFKQIIAGGQAYGTIKNSFDYGSAGGDCNGGNGGGMIYLNATFLEVNGTISSDGESGANYGARRGCDYDSRDGSGGGSGGSILIDAQTIRGNGSITSNGGIGGTGAYSYNGYAGGGGRIAIYYNNTYFTGDYISRSGSWGKIAEYISPYGGAGTIYIKGSESEDEYLIIDNQGYNSERETPLPNDLTIYNLSIERGAELTIDNETTLNATYLNGSGTLNLFGTLDANNFINSEMSELTIQNYNGNLTFLTESNYFN
ncbi:MAG: hypothetical protein U9R08_04560, partial [Nanoarchaeota archaeon]|nr:hypothetical protein [Nanoarchaeota archaeon]